MNVGTMERRVVINFTTKAEAEKWCESYPYDQIRDAVRFLTIDHAGHRLCVWSQWCDIFTDMNGGHFASSIDGPLLTLQSDETDIIAFLRERLAVGWELTLLTSPVTPSLDQWLIHIKQPCHLLIPLKG